MVYDELRRIARAEVRRLPAGQTLQATALVHEVWLRLAQHENLVCNDRAHFFALAAQAIRHIVIDSARRKAAFKRGGDRLRVELEHIAISTEVPADDLLTLDDALGELSKRSEQTAKIVNLRYFAGLTLDVIASLLGMSKRSVEREWEYARAWLHGRMHSADASVGDD
ncbi:MAG: hypothetical protein AMXMBFR47_39020 [Planctomycetota bacterium]